VTVWVAGFAVAVVCGLAGYLVVVRGQVFAGDALSHVSYAGALGALAAGLDLRVGVFAATLIVGVGLAVLGGRGIADDVIIGTTFAWVLGLGVLFNALYTTRRAGADPTANVRVLFGSIYGVSNAAAWTLLVVAAVLVLVLLALARPLLFATVDPQVAAARGVPLRAVGAAFLGCVGAVAAEATQLVGAVLLLGLLAAPAGAAVRLTDRPWRGLGLSCALAVVAVGAGLGVARAVASLPPSFAIISVATVLYAGAALAGRSVRGTGRTPRPCG
jgi:zinc/manganese transport system permease protein